MIIIRGILTFCFALVIYTEAASQKIVCLDSVINHLNDSITVCGKVKSVMDTLTVLRLTLKSEKVFAEQPTLENPDPIIKGALNVFAVLDVKDSLKRKYSPFVGKCACVTGFVNIINQVPTISLRDQRNFTAANE